MIPNPPYEIGPLQQVKHVLMGLTGLAKDALHIYVALFLFFGSMAMFRWPARDTRPLMLVAIAAFTGEIWDRIEAIMTQAPLTRWSHIHDIWNTILIPAAIFALARWTDVLRR